RRRNQQAGFGLAVLGPRTADQNPVVRHPYRGTTLRDLVRAELGHVLVGHGKRLSILAEVRIAFLRERAHALSRLVAAYEQIEAVEGHLGDSGDRLAVGVEGVLEE